MDGEMKMLLAFVAVCFTVIVCSAFGVKQNISMASKGYCQEQGYGTTSTLWVRCK